MATTYTIRRDLVECGQGRNTKLAPLVVRRPPSVHQHRLAIEVQRSKRKANMILAEGSG